MYENEEPLRRPLAPFEERFEANKLHAERLEIERQQQQLAAEKARRKDDRRVRRRSHRQRALTGVGLLAAVGAIGSAAVDVSGLF